MCCYDAWVYPPYIQQTVCTLYADVQWHENSRVEIFKNNTVNLGECSHELICLYTGDVTNFDFYCPTELDFKFTNPYWTWDYSNELEPNFSSIFLN